MVHSRPSLAEGVAGAMAMAEVLKDHGQQQAALQMVELMDEIREASWLTTGEQPVFELLL